MTTGQTGFAISDIPFTYSIIALIFFLSTGEFYSENHPEKFYLVILVSGLIGSFLLSFRPLQKLIEWYYYKKINNYTTFDVMFDDNRLIRRFRINPNSSKLSFKTEVINHEKNKVVTGIYYNIFLGMIIASLFIPKFQDLTQLHYENPLWYALVAGVVLMFIVMIHTNRKNLIALPYNIRRVGTYFDLMYRYGNNSHYRPDIDSIKQAIDLNDWQTVSQLLNLLLIRTHGEWASEMEKILKD